MRRSFLFCIFFLCFCAFRASAQTVLDINRVDASFPVFNPFVFNGHAYFPDSAVHGIPFRLIPRDQLGVQSRVPRSRILRFDPATGAVTLVKELSPSAVVYYDRWADAYDQSRGTFIFNNPEALYRFTPVVHGNIFYFLAINLETGFPEVWSSDGTTDGTVRLWADERNLPEPGSIFRNISDDQAVLSSASGKLVLLRNRYPLLVSNLNARGTVDFVPPRGVQARVMTLSDLASAYDTDGSNLYFPGLEISANGTSPQSVYRYDGDVVGEYAPFVAGGDVGIIDLLEVAPDGSGILIGAQRSIPIEGNTRTISTNRGTDIWFLDASTKEVQEVEGLLGLTGESYESVGFTTFADKFVGVYDEFDLNGRGTRFIFFLDPQTMFLERGLLGTGNRIWAPVDVETFIPYKGFLYLAWADTGDGLFRTDGTVGGIERVHRFNGEDFFGRPQGLFVIDDLLYLFARTDAHEGPDGSDPPSNRVFLQSIIKTDGLPGGLYEEIPYPSGSGGSSVLGADELPTAVFKGRVFFPGASSGYGVELYATGGTVGNTRRLDIRAGRDGGTPLFDGGNVAGDLFFFSALTEQSPGEVGYRGRELLVLDAGGKDVDALTSGDISLLRDIFPGPTSSFPAGFAELNGKVLFSAFSPGEGTELWTSDGTQAGTVLVANLYPDLSEPTGSSPDNLTTLGGKVYFTARSANEGVELWTTDGTEVGTTLLQDIVQGIEDSNPRYLLVHEDKLYFAALDGVEVSASIHQYDPATGNFSVLLAGQGNGINSNLTFVFRGVYRGKVLFSFHGTHDDGTGSRESGLELWVTDGTTAGTKFLKEINVAPQGDGDAFFFPPAINPAGTYSPAEHNGKLFFTADDGVHGFELWVVDAGANDPNEIESEDVTLYKDLFPGPRGSVPRDLVESNGRLYFSAHLPGSGRELVSIKDGFPDLQVRDRASSKVISYRDFGDVPLREERPATLCLVNTGSAPLTLTSISFLDTTGPFTVESGYTPPTIPAGGFEVVEVCLNSDAEGEYENQLVIDGDDIEAQHVIVRGKAVSPLHVTVEGSRVPTDYEESFGVLLDAAAPATRTVKITALAPLDVESITTSVATGTSIAFDSSSSAVAPPSGTAVELSRTSGAISYVVTFTPSSSDTARQRASLVIRTEGGGIFELVFLGSVGRYYVTKPGQSTELGATITEDFGDVFLGDVVELSYSIHNASQLASVFSITDVTGAALGYGFPIGRFGVHSADFSNLSVRFNPQEVGTDLAGGFVLEPSGDLPSTTFTFTANVVASGIKVRKEGEVAFFRSNDLYEERGIAGTEHTLTFEVSNSGGGDLRISGISVQGSGFVLRSPTDPPTETNPLVVPAGDTTDVVVFYSGAPSFRLRAGRLSIASNSFEDDRFVVNIRLGFSGGSGGSFSAQEEAAVQVYPNPAVDLVHVALPGPGSYGVRLYDVTGKAVFEDFFSGVHSSISLENYPEGVYVLELLGLPGGTEKTLLFVE